MVGATVGVDVGEFVGRAVGHAVGASVGVDVGIADGRVVGSDVGAPDGGVVGNALGCVVGIGVGTNDGAGVGMAVGDVCAGRGEREGASCVSRPLRSNASQGFERKGGTGKRYNMERKVPISNHKVDGNAPLVTRSGWATVASSAPLLASAWDG